MTLLVVELAPVVVLCDKPIGETACRKTVPLEITELVPLVFPEISTAEITVPELAAEMEMTEPVVIPMLAPALKEGPAIVSETEL